MDFFKAQEQARKKTRCLVVLFALAVVGISYFVYISVALCVYYATRGDAAILAFLSFCCPFLFLSVLIAFESILDIVRNRQYDPESLNVMFICIFLALGCLGLFFFEFTTEQRMLLLPPAHLFLPWYKGGAWYLSAFLLVSISMAAVSLYKVRQISQQGGALIANQLGGRMIHRNTEDSAERRLLNVIEEMSIAAGIPAPVAFVLDKETGLNTFTAGLTNQDNVIAVSRILLTTMNRNELQSVVAHEIGHIAHGDASLNLKLIGILHGLLIIPLLWKRCFESCFESNLFGRIVIVIFIMAFFASLAGKHFFLNLALFAVLASFVVYMVGSISLSCARLIHQATISREREYLADAAAVQLTRYPDGLISALKKLHTLGSGSGIQHPQSIAASHLFFVAGNISLIDFLFEAHPPLAKRIVRLGGDGILSARVLPLHSAKPPKHDKEAFPLPVIPYLTDNIQSEEISPENLTQAQNLLASLPDTLREQTHSFIGATGILAGLLFARQYEIRARQEKLLSPDTLPVAQELYQWLAEQLEHGAHYRLVWFDLVLPTLREASADERQQLLILAKDLIRADGHVSPTEFALYSLLRDALLSPSERQVKRHELRLEQLDKDISDLLALLTYSGHEDVKAAEAAYQAAIASSPASKKHPLPAKNELSLNKISEALSHLALAAPPYRQKLLEACVAAVQHDGKITPVENELLRAFAQSLDCPAPLV